jgi:putative CocE/NonD family hydrolase
MRVERDLPIAMRDGVILRADLYRPDGDRPVPAILSRTPYDRSIALTPLAAIDPERLTEAGLALVCQDVRGQHSSAGEFYPFVAEGSDGYDSIEWVAAQSWCSGAVGMAGRSYPAATQWLAAAERPPALKAIAPVVTGSDYYNGWIYQGGAFQLGFNLFWVHLMTAPGDRVSLTEQFRHLPLTSPPLLQSSRAGRFYRDWLAHPTDDEYWRTLAINRRYASIEVPALNVGGWYDLFLAGTLENYTRVRVEGATEAARAGARLVIGPWAHGTAFGPFPDHRFKEFGSDQQIDLSDMQIRFFARHLALEESGPQEEMPVRIFVMGENRWRDEADWPLARAREQRWFLHGGGEHEQGGEPAHREHGGQHEHGGELSPEAPGGEPPDEYNYDPREPAPTIGGPTSLPGGLLRTNSGPLDQHKLEARADVLVYSSRALERPLEVTGPLKLVLYAASTAPDTDFVGKLCDVSPDGRSRILAEGVLRARYRNGYESAQLLQPGEVCRYEIDLVATSNVFLPGHRIRVLITSSSFPRFDRNANSGLPLGGDSEQDLLSARQTIFHDDARASHIVLPVVGA